MGVLTADDLRELTKEDCPCCRKRCLPDGRLPIGFGGPECLMRQRRDLLLAERRRLARQLEL